MVDTINPIEAFAGRDASIPILLKNPDGTISEGLPPGYKDIIPPPSPRMIANAFFADIGGLEVPEEELEYLYARHESLFQCLVMFELAMDIVFNFLYVSRAPYALAELGMIYVGLSTWILARVFWFFFVVEVAYCVVYYSVALWTTSGHSAKKYSIFSQLCLGGIVGHVFMAYINKFNLLIFFLRIIAYMYACFLRSLCVSMQFAPTGNT